MKLYNYIVENSFSSPTVLQSALLCFPLESTKNESWAGSASRSQLLWLCGIFALYSNRTIFISFGNIFPLSSGCALSFFAFRELDFFLFPFFLYSDLLRCAAIQYLRFFFKYNTNKKNHIWNLSGKLIDQVLFNRAKCQQVCSPCHPPILNWEEPKICCRAWKIF